MQNRSHGSNLVLRRIIYYELWSCLRKNPEFTTTEAVAGFIQNKNAFNHVLLHQALNFELFCIIGNLPHQIQILDLVV